MRIKLLLVLFLSILFLNPIHALDNKDVIRVGISNQSFSSYEHQSVKLSSINMIKIVDMSSMGAIEPIEANKVVEVKFKDGKYNIYVDNELKYENLIGPLTFSSNAELQILDLNRKGTPAKYKGMIELKTAKNNLRFHIINVIDMQNYLRGVVPNEMPISFGLEALKAQSVAARNYAYNAKISPNYDVVDSTASQVYYGANSYREISDTAINQTQGIYALYHDKPISALYFSTSAGMTDDWDDVFNNGVKSNFHPYLKARADIQGQKPLKSEAEVVKFYSSNTTGIDTNSPKFRWNFEFTRNELEEVLHTTLQQQSKAGLVSPSYDGDDKLEGLKEIKPLKRTQSGKITELLIVAKNGEYVVKKELGIRRVLKKNNQMLPSANFFIETTGSEYLGENKQPNKVEIKDDENSKIIKLFDNIGEDKYPSKFKFIGGGFGHGVGMSQFGAYNLAKQGKKYPEILHAYYTDINISTLPKTVLYNEYNVFYKTEFYFSKKDFKAAYLIIDNQKNVSEFPFKINEYEFLDTKDAAFNRLIKMNVTQYLKEGKNTVTFAPLTKENKGRYIKFRLELI